MQSIFINHMFICRESNKTFKIDNKNGAEFLFQKENIVRSKIENVTYLLMNRKRMRVCTVPLPAVHWGPRAETSNGTIVF